MTFCLSTLEILVVAKPTPVSILLYPFSIQWTEHGGIQSEISFMCRIKTVLLLVGILSFSLGILSVITQYGGRKASWTPVHVRLGSTSNLGIRSKTGRAYHDGPLQGLSRARSHGAAGALTVVNGRPGKALSNAMVHVLVLRYMGQQGVAVKALTSLQCWTGHTGLPVAIVEPALSGTVMTGNIVREDMAMSDLFDIDHFNTLSRLNGYPEVIEKGEFFKQSSKNIVFVTIEKGSEFKEESAQTCLAPSNSVLASLTEKGYCIVKEVSVSNERLTTQTFRDILGSWLDVGVTVVFSRFGPWLSSEGGVKCKGINDNSTNAQYQPSIKVLDGAESYEQLYLDTADPIAVMLRTEHILYRNRFNLTQCLQDVVTTTKRVQGGSTSNIPMIALDFGKYGSNTWEWAVADHEARVTGKRLVEETLQVLLGNKMSFEEWEETFAIATGNRTSPGYMAAVQRSIASRAKCLIMMGGGDFQELILRDYLKFHAEEEKRCAHLVCADNERRLLNLVRPPTSKKRHPYFE